MAEWKLVHVGIDLSWFSLFVTSDDFEDRISLAKSVFTKIENETDIYIIGDAVGDIQCAHAIGATSIIATTGRHKKMNYWQRNQRFLLTHLWMSGYCNC